MIILCIYLLTNKNSNFGKLTKIERFFGMFIILHLPPPERSKMCTCRCFGCKTGNHCGYNENNCDGVYLRPDLELVLAFLSAFLSTSTPVT